MSIDNIIKAQKIFMGKIFNFQRRFRARNATKHEKTTVLVMRWNQIL